tara:strand:- start:261 stop:671 length:411 start_codon:yes stop_codon:yes gene_type:complete
MSKNFPKEFCFLIFLFLFYSSAWGMKNSCEVKKFKFHSHADQLIQEIEKVELCARPAPKFRDKVFSNLKYRSNRLKTCVQMVKQENLGFDCSREFRKTVKADGGENCVTKFNVMKNSFKTFETLFSGYQNCLKNKD